MVTKPIDQNLMWRKFWDVAKQVSWQFGRPKLFFMIVSETDVSSPRPFTIEGAIVPDFNLTNQKAKKELSDKILREYLKRPYSSCLAVGVPYSDEKTMVGFRTQIGQNCSAFAARFRESEFGYDFAEAFLTCPELDSVWCHSPSPNVRELINDWFPTYQTLQDSEGKDGLGIWNL